MGEQKNSNQNHVFVKLHLDGFQNDEQNIERVDRVHQKFAKLAHITVKNWIAGKFGQWRVKNYINVCQ